MNPYLASLSEFLGSPIHDKDIEYQGRTRTFKIKEGSADELEALFLAPVAGKDKEKPTGKGLRNRIISLCVVDDEGKQAMTEKEAGTLPNELANKLQAAVLDVNGIKVPDAKGETEKND